MISIGNCVDDNLQVVGYRLHSVQSISCLAFVLLSFSLALQL